MKQSLAGVFLEGTNRQQPIPLNVSRKKTLSICVAAALVVGASMMTFDDVEAADTKRKSKNKTYKTNAVDELQAENARLRQQVEQLLAAQRGGAAPATGATSAIDSGAPATAATKEPTEIAAKEEVEETKDLGEVVVKGRRSPPLLEKLHNVKRSESVISGKDLDRQLVQDLGGITRRASNVQFNQNNTRGASLSIRGVGKRSFTETQDPSVGITVDNVSYGLSQLANFSFYDVDNVVVTRGPRGTEGGLSASSGKVIVTSRAPSFSPTADLSIAYGQQEALIIKGALGGAVVDDLLAWRGSFIVDKARGYYGQQYDGNYSLYNRDRLSGRVQLLFTPTSNITTKIMADFEPRQPQLQNGLDFFHSRPTFYPTAPGIRTDITGTTAQSKLNGFVNASGAVVSGPRAYFQNRGFTWNDYIGGPQRGSVWFDENKGQTVSNQGASLQTDWAVADHVLTSTTAVREYSFDAHNDEGTPFNISVDGGGGVNYTQYTQEFKIKNNPGGFFDYKAGLFGMKTHNDVASKTGWGSDAGAWFANNAQYNVMDTNAGINRGAGLAMLKDSLQDGRKKGDTEIHTLSGAIFGEGELHFSENFSIIPGLRVTKESRNTTDNITMTANGVGGAFNPVAVRGIQLGGFNSNNATGALTAGNSATQLQTADSIANRYYGATVTNTPGAAYNSLTAAQKIQVGNAKAIRATQIGQLYNASRSEYDDVLFTAQFTPTYKINDNINTYLSWQYGQKSGSAININGLPANVKPELTNAVELGFKTFWLDKSIIFNIDAFVMDIRNYQQTVQAVDTFQTALNNNGLLAYTAVQGNVNQVRVHGVELDSAFNIIPELSVRLNGAYNIAEYVDYKNAALPDELGYLSSQGVNYVDMSGRRLPGSSKWSFVVGADYNKPFYDKYVFHSSVTTNYQSSFNNADNLSAYGQVNGTTLTDAAIGVGTKNNVLDISFIVKNVFTNNAHESGWNSYGPYPYPRWYGIQLSGKI